MRPSSHLPATFKPGKGEAHNCGAGEAFETLWLNSDESRRTHGSCGIRAPDRHRGFGIARIAGPRVRSFDMQQFVTSHSRREFIRQLAGAGIMISALPPGRRLFGAEARHLPEAALTFPGPWAFSVPKGGIILVSDQQLEDLQDPDKEVDLSLSKTPNVTTLRKVCEGAKAQGARTVILAFDEFWSQYRKGQGGKPRQLLPDTEAYIQRLARDQPDSQTVWAGAGAEPAESVGDWPRLRAEDGGVGPVGAIMRGFSRPGNGALYSFALGAAAVD